MDEKNKKILLDWGESVAVRIALIETSRSYVVFDHNSIEKLGYPNHFGDPALVELTKKVIKRQTGNDYKYILITNGATGGVTIAMRNYRINHNRIYCITDNPPYFRLFPSMIKSAGLFQLHGYEKANEHPQDSVILIDSPSNPLNKFSNMKKNIYDTPIIWDSTYHNNIYSPGNHPQPQHDIMVGSYGKLTGINGLRVGWIVTNDIKLYEQMKVLVEAEYCGISAVSTKLIMDTVGQFTEDDWEAFELNAQNKLDYNRSEFSKLEKFFDGSKVSPYGMFFYSHMDSACKKLFEKSNIIWSPGSQLGTNDNFGRFNLGQDIQLVRKAVKTVLKNDKLK